MRHHRSVSISERFIERTRSVGALASRGRLGGLALAAVLVSTSTASAIVLSGGPSLTPPGGGSCGVTANANCNGTACTSPAGTGGVTITCSGLNLAASGLRHLYFGVNNAPSSGNGPNGNSMKTSQPSGTEVFRFSSITGANQINYSASTTIENASTNTISPVSEQNVLVFQSGTGSLITDGTITGLNNASGDVSYLWQVASSTFTTTVNVKASGNNALPTVFNPTSTPVGAQDIVHVNLAFYWDTCGNGTVEGAEQCDAGANNGTPGSCCDANCKFVSAGVTCRGSAGACDLAETCTGTSATCPADALAPASTVCRAAAGSCDVAETCTGSSVTCPADGFAPPSQLCRASGGVCDPAEFCDGVSANCPPNAFFPSSTICRSSAGVCDVAENCTGSSAACPADGFASASTVCRPAAGSCDVAENCTGAGALCPVDTVLPSSTVCRTAAGVCDVAESCTGTSGICPADAKSTAVCRPAVDVCDKDDVCDGLNDTCPADSVQGAFVECRAAVGACDAAETCDGVNTACPADAFAPTSVVCRGSTGACDPAENCTGTDASCPSDALSPNGTVCRAAAGVCDVAESCDGVSGQCPADAFQASTTVCRPSAGVCDVAETCTGASAACPANAFQPSTTVCRAAASSCDIAESCTGSSASCPADQVSPDSDGDGTCDITDNCPAVVNASQADGDGDHIGDQCDPCTNAANIQTTHTKLIISKLSTPPGDDKLKYKGEIIVPTTPALDLIAKGARLIITDSTGATIVDATLPAGSYNPAQKAGWKGNAAGTAFQYLNSGSVVPLVGGIYKASIKKVLSTPGRLKFAFAGKLGSYAVASNHLPLHTTLSVEGAVGIDNQCGDSRFPGPHPVPSCTSIGGGSAVRCN